MLTVYGPRSTILYIGSVDGENITFGSQPQSLRSHMMSDLPEVIADILQLLVNNKYVLSTLCKAPSGCSVHAMNPQSRHITLTIGRSNHTVERLKPCSTKKKRKPAKKND
jgi:hypothetical protein